MGLGKLASATNAVVFHTNFVWRRGGSGGAAAAASPITGCWQEQRAQTRAGLTLRTLDGSGGAAALGTLLRNIVRC